MIKYNIDEIDNCFILFTKNSCNYCDMFKSIIESIHTKFEDFGVTFYILSISDSFNKKLKDDLICEDGCPFAYLKNGSKTSTIRGLVEVLEIVSKIDEVFG